MSDLDPPPLAVPADPAGSASSTAANAGRYPALRRFADHRMALLGVGILAVVVLLALLAPLVATHAPNEVDLTAVNHKPGGGHLLGADNVGRDIWARLVFGARTSLIVGFGAVAISLLIGITVGMLAGFYGRWIGALLMRITDAVMSVPPLVMVIVFVAIAGPSLVSVTVVIALTTWPAAARLVRGQVLALREREFITAAEVIGVPRRGIVLRHLLPNLLGPLSVVGTFGVANAILVEAGLSFLGLGVRPPTSSWGQMVNAAQSPVVLMNRPWIWVPASVAIVLTVLAVNFVGDGLRDAMDPKGSR
ncbi:ABC transporter permease [Dactylosporangium sp. NPDC000555]|uniref:ABC transporter permease n=1 Tax=Dactylosporangium sp. NPDC000555 TaxID=3154260 RepID=UPI00331972F2